MPDCNGQLDNLVSKFRRIQLADSLTSEEKKDYIYKAVQEFREGTEDKEEFEYKPKVGVLTIKDCEKIAVLEAFSFSDNDRRKHELTYYVKDFVVSTGRNYTIHVVKSPLEGQASAAVATTYLIERYKLDIVICCGIAGGVDGEVNLGDVIIAQRVIYFEPGKVTPDGTLPNPMIRTPDSILLDRANNLPLWKAPQFQLKGKKIMPVCRFGVLATGDKIIAKPEKMKVLRDNLSYKIVGVETEGDGFGLAIWLTPRLVRGLVIRGVSDYAGLDKANPDWEEKESLQIIAAKSAASYLKHLIYDDPLLEGKVST